jgi:hypothetical protein
LLALVGSKTVVFGSMPDAEFVQVLEAKGKLPPELQPQVNVLLQKPVWAVVNLQTVLKDKVPDLNGLAVFPGGAEALPAIKNAKIISFSIDAPGDAIVQMAMQCASDPDAGLVEKLAKDSWELKAKPLLGLLPLMMGNQPGAEGVTMLVKEVTQNLLIQRQGSVVTASLTLTEKTMKELEKFQLPAGMNPPGKNRPAMQPPGVQPGGPKLPFKGPKKKL